MQSSLMIQKYEEDFIKLINKFYNIIKNEVSIDKKALQSFFYDSVKEYRTHIFSLIEKSFNPDSLITSDSFNLNDELFYLYKNTLSKKLSEFNIIENREVSIIDNFIKDYIELDILLLSRYYSYELQQSSSINSVIEELEFFGNIEKIDPLFDTFNKYEIKKNFITL